MNDQPTLYRFELCEHGYKAQGAHVISHGLSATFCDGGRFVPVEPNYEAAADAYLASKKALTPPSEATILIGVEMRHIVAAVDAAYGEPA